MKLIRVVAVLAAVAFSLALYPAIQALPYFGLAFPPAPPAPPTPPVPPTPPAIPAVASIDVVPEPPEPPEPPQPPAAPSWWSDDDGDGDKYVVSVGDMTVVNGDGDTNLEHLHHAYGREFFWFHHDGQSYIVRDAAKVRDLAELYRPQSDLGREQGALGRKQGALGRKQGELGRRQGELGREQARLGVEQARLSFRFDDDDPTFVARRRDWSGKSESSRASRTRSEKSRTHSAASRRNSAKRNRASAIVKRLSAASWKENFVR